MVLVLVQAGGIHVHQLYSFFCQKVWCPLRPDHPFDFDTIFTYSILGTLWSLYISKQLLASKNHTELGTTFSFLSPNGSTMGASRLGVFLCAGDFRGAFAPLRCRAAACCWGSGQDCVPWDGEVTRWQLKSGIYDVDAVDDLFVFLKMFLKHIKRCKYILYIIYIYLFLYI